MEDFILTIGLVLAILSLLITTFLIFLHFWIPKLRKHPGQFVLIQCVFQFCYDLHWLTSYPQISHTFVDNSSVCFYSAIFTNACFNFGVIYVCVLTLELIIKFNHTASFAYYKRSIFYHFFAVVFIVISEFLYFLIGAFGKTKFNTCAVSSTEADIIEDILILISFIFLLLSLIYLCKKLSLGYSKVMWNYFLVVFSVILTWHIPSILVNESNQLDGKSTVIAAYLLGTTSGIVVGLARLIDGKIYSQLTQRSISERKRSALQYTRKQFFITGMSKPGSLKEGLMTNQEDFRFPENISSFSDLFESISNKVTNIQTLLEIVSTLFVHFSEYAKVNEECLEKKDKTDGFVYSNFEFSKLRTILSEKEINYCN
jgi:hypothetical protein